MIVSQSVKFFINTLNWSLWNVIEHSLYYTKLIILKFLSYLIFIFLILVKVFYIICIGFEFRFIRNAFCRFPKWKKHISSMRIINKYFQKKIFPWAFMNSRFYEYYHNNNRDHLTRNIVGKRFINAFYYSILLIAFL